MSGFSVRRSTSKARGQLLMSRNTFILSFPCCHVAIDLKVFRRLNLLLVEEEENGWSEGVDGSPCTTVFSEY